MRGKRSYLRLLLAAKRRLEFLMCAQLARAWVFGLVEIYNFGCQLFSKFTFFCLVRVKINSLLCNWVQRFVEWINNALGTLLLFKRQNSWSGPLKFKFTIFILFFFTASCREKLSYWNILIFVELINKFVFRHYFFQLAIIRKIVNQRLQSFNSELKVNRIILLCTYLITKFYLWKINFFF